MEGHDTDSAQHPATPDAASVLDRIDIPKDAIARIEALIGPGASLVIADAGLAPPDEMVERFLNASGKNPSGSDYSGMPHYCKTHGLPVADWRDYRKLTTINLLYPGAGVAK